MDIQKVFELLGETGKRKFWGTIAINFRGGVPDSITKSQKILFDPYQAKTAQEGAPEKETGTGRRREDQPSPERSGTHRA